MEIQEALNIAVRGVVKQGRLAASAAGCCFYQMGKNGPRCAIGHLLTDEQLHLVRIREANTKPVSGLVGEGILDFSFRHPFFTELQSAHDHASSLQDFVEKARGLAIIRGLTFPDLSDLPPISSTIED